MKILSWNCQGLANTLTVKALKHWCWQERPDFVFVMETMIAKEKLDVARVGCGFNYGFYFSSVENSGGLGLWWNGVDVALLHIMIEVTEPDVVNKWFACGIYGWADCAEKYKTWDLIRSRQG